MKPASVSVTGVAASAWLPVDYALSGPNPGVYVKPGAGATISVQVTCDPMDGSVTPDAFAIGTAALTGLVGNVAAALPFACTGIRMNQTVGVTTSTLTLVPSGLI